MTDEVAQFLNESSGDTYPYMKFKNLKDFVSGRIIESRIQEQDSKFHRGEKEKVLLISLEVSKGKGVVGIKTDEGPASEVPVKETPRVTLWIKKGFMAQAVSQAVKGAGEKTLAEGGTLTMGFIDEKDVGQPQPAKVYKASYEPPARGLDVSDFEDYDDSDVPF